MNRIISIFKKELMLSVSLLAAIVSLFITPPDSDLLKNIDWRTLATLFMLLSVLEGKHFCSFTAQDEPPFKNEKSFAVLCFLCLFYVHVRNK